MSVVGLSAAEWQTVKDASAILERLKDDLPVYLSARNKASRKWDSEAVDFIEVDANSLRLISISTYGEDEWERGVVQIDEEELLDLETHYQRHVAIGEVVAETQRAESDKRARENREAQYRALKEEFEGGLT